MRDWGQDPGAGRRYGTPDPQYPTTPPGQRGTPGTDRKGATYLLFGLGGGLLALSPVLPWVNILFIGSVSLFRLASLANSVVVLPWAMVGVGLGIVVATLSQSRLETLSVVSVATVLLALVFGGGDFADLVRAVDSSHGIASLGIGMYAAVAALVLLSVAAWREYRTARASSRRQPYQPQRPTQPVPQDPRPGFKPDPWGMPGKMRHWDGRSWGPETR